MIDTLVLWGSLFVVGSYWFNAVRQKKIEFWSSSELQIFLVVTSHVVLGGLLLMSLFHSGGRKQASALVAPRVVQNAAPISAASAAPVAYQQSASPVQTTVPAQQPQRVADQSPRYDSAPQYSSQPQPTTDQDASSNSTSAVPHPCVPQ
jgi:hypothetical protein